MPLLSPLSKQHACFQDHQVNFKSMKENNLHRISAIIIILYVHYEVNDNGNLRSNESIFSL